MRIKKDLLFWKWKDAGYSCEELLYDDDDSSLQTGWIFKRKITLPNGKQDYEYVKVLK